MASIYYSCREEAAPDVHPTQCIGIGAWLFAYRRDETEYVSIKERRPHTYRLNPCAVFGSCSLLEHCAAILIYDGANHQVPGYPDTRHCAHSHLDPRARMWCLCAVTEDRLRITSRYSA